MNRTDLLLYTTYAELLERCSASGFDAAFSEEGAFVAKEVKGRRYWYFQCSSASGRIQRYVGPETPALLERIAQHRKARDDERERRSLVSTLVRSFRMPRPLPEIGRVVEALARAGTFRLRGVLVGTVAFQTYSAMLAARLPLVALQTGDVDIAQFADASVAVQDHTPPMLEVLQQVDGSFRVVAHPTDKTAATSYAGGGAALRVEFLTPSRGPEGEAPVFLQSLRTHAQPLRFLDFLIRDPERAVLLHEAGVLVQVPAPQRYALHKLIVSRRRRPGEAKREKDLRQAQALLQVLVERRPDDLRLAWEEAWGRGQRWRALLLEGLAAVASSTRDTTLKALGKVRSILPQADLVFAVPPLRYDFHRDVVRFRGEAAGKPVECAISREALDDHFGADDLDQQGTLDLVRRKRTLVEALARQKYLHWPIDQADAVLVTTLDVPRLQRELSTKTAS